MATVLEQKEQRIELHNVSWVTYEHLLADHLDCRNPRFTYDRGTLEIMSPSAEHEETNLAISNVVSVITEEWEVDMRSLGSTTFKREDLDRGFEPDSCFYIQHTKAVKGKREINLLADPPPDLIVEIDITSGSINKLPIFAALGVPEVWRYSGQRLVILGLNDGAYIELERSLALPGLTGAIVMAFIRGNLTIEHPAWKKGIRDWARDNRPA